VWGTARRAKATRARASTRAAGACAQACGCSAESLGLLNTAPDVALCTLARAPARRGSLAIASDSAARGTELLARLAERHIGVSSFVSLGRRADVSANDCLSFWLDDPATHAVALDVASVGNAPKFERLAARLTRAKPLFALATGQAAQDQALARAGATLTPSLDALLRLLR
jgi:acyl-CoA synthetase (NDP forming)